MTGIIDEMCRSHGMTREQLRQPAVRGGRGTPTHIRVVRDATMYRLRCEGLSFPRIAALMGLKDHTSVMAAVERHCRMHDLDLPENRNSVHWSAEEDALILANPTSPSTILQHLPHRTLYGVIGRRHRVLKMGRWSGQHEARRSA